MTNKRHTKSLAALLSAALLLTVLPGCRSWRERRETAQTSQPARRTVTATPPRKPAPRPAAPAGAPIRRVVSLFDQRPWLNLDTAGDRDPEGLQFRVFLDDGTARGALRDGTLHVEMYRIFRDQSGATERKLVSDWHYPTAEVATVRSNMLGDGYHLSLRWAEKEVAGNDVEIFVSYESPDGQSVRSGTKRLRVPKYSSSYRAPVQSSP